MNEYLSVSHYRRFKAICIELFGTDQPHCCLRLNEKNEPKIVLHDGKGNVVESASWKTWKWVKDVN